MKNWEKESAIKDQFAERYITKWQFVKELAKTIFVMFLIGLGFVSMVYIAFKMIVDVESSETTPDCVIMRNEAQLNGYSK